MKGENVAVGLLQKTLLIGLFGFFVANWPMLINTVLDGFIWSGFTAAGSTPAAGLAVVKDPSSIVAQAFIVTAADRSEDQRSFLVRRWIAFLCMGGLTFLPSLAFFMLAIQIFVTYLEFYLVAALSTRARTLRCL